MGKEAKQSELEAQTAKDEVRQLQQTVDHLQLELQVCCYYHRHHNNGLVSTYK